MFLLHTYTKDNPLTAKMAMQMIDEILYDIHYDEEDILRDIYMINGKYQETNEVKQYD